MLFPASGVLPHPAEDLSRPMKDTWDFYKQRLQSKKIFEAKTFGQHERSFVTMREAPTFSSRENEETNAISISRQGRRRRSYYLAEKRANSREYARGRTGSVFSANEEVFSSPQLRSERGYLGYVRVVREGGRSMCFHFHFTCKTWVSDTWSDRKFVHLWWVQKCCCPFGSSYNANILLNK